MGLLHGGGQERQLATPPERSPFRRTLAVPCSGIPACRCNDESVIWAWEASPDALGSSRRQDSLLRSGQHFRRCCWELPCSQLTPTCCSTPEKPKMVRILYVIEPSAAFGGRAHSSIVPSLGTCCIPSIDDHRSISPLRASTAERPRACLRSVLQGLRAELAASGSESPLRSIAVDLEP